jgi:hypothetical protein
VNGPVPEVVAHRSCVLPSQPEVDWTVETPVPAVAVRVAQLVAGGPQAPVTVTQKLSTTPAAPAVAV